VTNTYHATNPPYRIAMNSVDIAAFIAKDDAEYLGDIAAQRSCCARSSAPGKPSRSRRPPARAQTKPRPWHERGLKSA
jgi:hypothetical protein